MAEESNDLQLFQNYKIIPKEPFNTDTKCVEDFSSETNSCVKCVSDFDKLEISVDNSRISELSLVDINDEESIWLAEGVSTNEGTESEWLKGQLDLTGLTVEKNTLINKLDNLARKSESHLELSPRSPSNDINERSLISPPIFPSEYLSSQPVSSTPAARSPASKVSQLKMLEEADANATIITSHQPLNSTFNRESANSTFSQEASSPTSNGLDSTFNKDEVQNFNSTFSKEGNATFNQTGNMNATFDLSQEKINSSIETPERVEEITTKMNKESELKARSPMNYGESSKTSIIMDSLNNSNDIKSLSCPASPASHHGSEIQPKPVSRLGAANIKPQLSRNRLPPPSRLQAPPPMHYQTPVRSQGGPPPPLIPRGAPGPPPPLIPRVTPDPSGSGKVRSGLRPPMSVPRNVLKPPTAIPKTSLRLPAQVPGKTLRQPTIPHPNVQKPSSLRPPSNLRPPASVVESGLRKPSGIVRPSALARTSGLARPTGATIPGTSGLARPSGAAIPGTCGLARPAGVTIARPAGVTIPGTCELTRPAGAAIPGPSGFTRPTGATIPGTSGLTRSAGGAIQAGVRLGKTKQKASSHNDVLERTGSGANSRLVTG